MTLDNLDLHTIAEAREIPDHGGLRLQRVPEALRDQLEEPARGRVLHPAGAEIRFVMEGDSARITLSSSEAETQVVGYFGPFISREHWWTLGKEPRTLELTIPEGLRNYPRQWYSRHPFSPRVCRLALFRGHVHLHGVEGSVRPPEPEELPSRTMLAYGTSITHGAAASAFHLSYVAQTARRLGVDLANYGVGGACCAEGAWGEYFASLQGWDFAILALSVNMVGAGFTVEQFGERVRFLIRAVAESDLSRPVACISIYPYFGDWGALQPAAKATPEEFRTRLRNVVDELALPNLHFIPGPQILSDVSGLTTDMVHPSDLGMITMGENLAARLGPILGDFPG